MQADPIVTRVSELMRLGLTPSAEEIRNGVVSTFRSGIVRLPNGCRPSLSAVNLTTQLTVVSLLGHPLDRYLLLKGEGKVLHLMH